MLRFIFGKKETPTVKTETQRESFERVMAELNGLLEEQPIKPSVLVDMETGGLTLNLPEQLADEALALPAPTEKAETEVTPEVAPKEAEVEAPDAAKA